MSAKPLKDPFEEWGANNSGHVLGGSVGRVDTSSASQRKGIGSTAKNHSGSSGESHSSGVLTRADLERVVNKSPEAMVKISKCSKDQQSIKGYLKYISRDGALELEDNEGLLVRDKKERSDLVKDWDETSVYGIDRSNGKKRETINVILSMPPGTARAGLRAAASEFAKAHFKENPYVFVAHNDEKHPHVHLVVRMEQFDGKRINPRKADLNRWRKSFAEKLRNEGIDANATPRRARGVVIKPVRQAIHHINDEHFNGPKKDREKPDIERREYLSKVSSSNYKMAQAEALGKTPARVIEAKKPIEKTRKAVLSEYAHLQAALLAGDEKDQALAAKIKTFVDGLPSTRVRYDMLFNNILAKLPEQKINQSSGSGLKPDEIKRTNKLEQQPTEVKQAESKMRQHLKRSRNGPKLG